MTNTDNLLKEILKWNRLVGREILNKKIKDCLPTKEDILVYTHTDGKNSSRKIEKLTGAGYKKVQSLWKKWIKEGIAAPSDKYSRGRCVRIFEISDFGVEQ